MADRGIIFSAPMVRALVDGRKTQTRRLLSLRGYRGLSQFGVSDTQGYDWHFRRSDGCWCDISADRLAKLLPHWPGDRLYAREAWSHTGNAVWTIEDARRSGFCNGHPIYRADHEGFTPERWWPSIHMPREFSRITQLVREVRVQRLQDISEQDAIAEGLEALTVFNDGPNKWSVQIGGGSLSAPTARETFALLWNSLHTKLGERWDDNPWIYALTFEVVRENIDRLG